MTNRIQSHNPERKGRRAVPKETQASKPRVKAIRNRPPSQATNPGNNRGRRGNPGKGGNNRERKDSNRVRRVNKQATNLGSSWDSNQAVKQASKQVINRDSNLGSCHF